MLHNLGVHTKYKIETCTKSIIDTCFHFILYDPFCYNNENMFPFDM